MKNIRIVKTLAIAALSTLTLLAGTSQANDWGHYERANTPYFPDRPNFDRPNFDRPNFDRPGFDQRGPDAFQRPAAGYGIDTRQQQQMAQIMHGLRSGELTRHEARDLMQEQRVIEQMQRHYLADGRLSRDEWLQLDRRLDRAAHDIRAEKRDGDWR